MGSGEILVGEPITVDLWPRDRGSACFTDMTGRSWSETWTTSFASTTTCARSHSTDRSRDLSGGATTQTSNALPRRCLKKRDNRRSSPKAPGEVLLDGFFHSLGHGVGLEVHEEPHLAPGKGTLVVGDVVAVEPGCYRQGFGGVRLEDLVLVTDDDAEVRHRLPLRARAMTDLAQSTRAARGDDSSTNGSELCRIPSVSGDVAETTRAAGWVETRLRGAPSTACSE